MADSWELWLTLGTVAALVVALASNRIGPDTAMLGALTVLLVAGVVEPARAVAGFADPAVLMIGALFVVAAGMTETGAMAAIAERMLGRPRSIVGAQLRMMIPVAATSAFMNNTPIVAMYMPIVHDWARRLRLSPSKLFMPLSFAAILGGACTLIGTSTNLAVNQLYLEYYRQHAESLQSRFGLVEPSNAKQFWWVGTVGIPAAVVGLAFIAIASRWLLPERRAPDAGGNGARQYTVELIAQPRSPIVGKSIEQAGLRQLPGLYLVEIERDGERLPAVAPDERIQAGDRLVFAGVVESVVDLLKIRGLAPATDQVGKVDADRRDRTVVEAVVSHGSPLVRRTVREAQFRTRYNAAIIAVHRNGQRVRGKIGDIVLQPGDTLLLSTHRGFVPAYRNSSDFYLVSNVDSAREVRHERAWVALAIMALLVLLLTLPTGSLFRALNQQYGLHLPATGLPPLAAGFLCATLMVYTRCCTGTAARTSINWQVLLVIAAAMGIGRAMADTGAAQFLADGLFQIVGPLGPRSMLFLFALLTSAISQLITNKGAAVLMFPIAMALAEDAGVSPEPFAVTLMVAAACSFLTPVGFVTNLMVFGPGGYRFFDYARLGLPLTLLVAALAAGIAPVVFPFSG